jgi:hypothetical protein
VFLFFAPLFFKPFHGSFINVLAVFGSVLLLLPVFWFFRSVQLGLLVFMAVFGWFLIGVLELIGSVWFGFVGFGRFVSFWWFLVRFGLFVMAFFRAFRFGFSVSYSFFFVVVLVWFLG